MLCCTVTVCRLGRCQLLLDAASVLFHGPRPTGNKVATRLVTTVRQDLVAVTQYYDTGGDRQQRRLSAGDAEISPVTAAGHFQPTLSARCLPT